MSLAFPKTPVLTAEAARAQKRWVLIDAAGKPLGRLATEVANILRGKNKPQFSPHLDLGDNVIIINAAQISLSGKKMDQKIYRTHSGYLGGLKEIVAKKLQEKDPTALVREAVSGMLPKNTLRRTAFMKNLRIYAGAEHGQAGQIGKLVKPVQQPAAAANDNTAKPAKKPAAKKAA